MRSAKGLPHPKNKRVFFARVEYDGFRLKKGVRIACEGDQLPKALEHFEGAHSEEGFSGWSLLDRELSFAPGACIPAREPAETEIDGGLRLVIRARTAFTALHAPELVALNTENAIDLRKARRAIRIVLEGLHGEEPETRTGSICAFAFSNAPTGIRLWSARFVV